MQTNSLKRRWSTLCLSALLMTIASSTLVAEPLTEAERERLVAHLGKTRQALLDAVDGLSKKQWNYKPSEDKWSIAECTEHLAIVEEVLGKNVVELLESPAVDRSDTAKEDEVMKAIVDRSQKFKAPEVVAPAQRWKKRKAMLKAFEAQRAAAVKIAKEAQDLRSFVGPHPAFGDLDAYTWLFFLSGHTERHIAQIEEVKEDPGFPKR